MLRPGQLRRQSRQLCGQFSAQPQCGHGGACEVLAPAQLPRPAHFPWTPPAQMPGTVARRLPGWPRPPRTPAQLCWMSGGGWPGRSFSAGFCAALKPGSLPVSGGVHTGLCELEAGLHKASWILCGVGTTSQVQKVPQDRLLTKTHGHLTALPVLAVWASFLCCASRGADAAHQTCTAGSA